MIYRNRGRLSPVSPRLINQAKVLLRNLQVQMNYFNLSVSWITFLLKFHCMVFTILGGFAAICLASSDMDHALLFCGLYTVWFMDGLVAFLAIFNSMHGLTDGIEELKKEILVHSSRLPLAIDRRETQKFIQSIPMLAVKSGGFNMVERESTLIFVHFVIQQIVSLLIAYNEP